MDEANAPRAAGVVGTLANVVKLLVLGVIGAFGVLGFLFSTGGERESVASPTAVFVERPLRDDGWLPIESFLEFDRMSVPDGAALLDQAEAHWRDGYAPMLLEATRFGWYQRAAVLHRLRPRMGLNIEQGTNEAWRRVWANDYERHPEYARFKERLYRQVDPRFANYFDDNPQATIRLDEVRWGGVVRDGIPPLDSPRMLAAEQADYLADTDVVFGIAINGDARAYPKRVLAWHEMFKDTIGGVSICGVYCTLCGMVIPYETEFNGKHHELGTSGFLYRSNKLMYDHATESMWSTTKGEPVIGPLVGEGIKLKTRPVVTTTWGEWRRRRPETSVLSRQTGHDRNYSEGFAYKDYFATDRLMFSVPDLPPHADATGPLANKAEVLALRFGESPVAITAEFLASHPVYHGEHEEQRFVVLTDPSGGNRVYAAPRDPIEQRGGALRDTEGRVWTASEDRLTSDDGLVRQRLPAHRAFWFGWRAAHPDTRLIGG